MKANLDRAIEEMGQVLDLVDTAYLDVEVKTLLIKRGVTLLALMIEVRQLVSA